MQSPSWFDCNIQGEGNQGIIAQRIRSNRSVQILVGPAGFATAKKRSGARTAAEWTGD
jgi:hypothetical protein